jgi:hypothetical protein
MSLLSSTATYLFFSSPARSCSPLLTSTLLLLLPLLLLVAGLLLLQLQTLN